MQDAELGRLAIDPLSGLKKGYDRSKTFDKQGPYDKLFAYGGRSWAILDAGNGEFVAGRLLLLQLRGCGPLGRWEEGPAPRGARAWIAHVHLHHVWHSPNMPSVGRALLTSLTGMWGRVASPALLVI